MKLPKFVKIPYSLLADSTEFDKRGMCQFHAPRFIKGCNECEFAKLICKYEYPIYSKLICKYEYPIYSKLFCSSNRCKKMIFLNNSTFCPGHSYLKNV